MSHNYNERKADGVCTYCGINEPVPGSLTCDYCSDKRYESEKARIQKFQRQGLCTCGRPLATSKAAGKLLKRCRVCLDKEKAYKGTKRNDKHLKAAGLLRMAETYLSRAVEFMRIHGLGGAEIAAFRETLADEIAKLQR
jgi:hypothetical protein